MMVELTQTQALQEETALVVAPLLQNRPKLFNFNKHYDYLKKMLESLPSYFSVLDASKAWMIYWELNSLAVMNKLDGAVKTRAISSLRQLRGVNGGFCGGNGQQEHVLSTYAAVLSICLCGDDEAFALIEKEKLLRWFYSLKNYDGSFRVNHEGESDARSAYAVVCVASLLGLPGDHDLFKDTLEWLCKCQTYEGGLAGVPYAEAHGGYTYCALAAIALLQGVHNLDIPRLVKWLLQRQDSALFGFSGRTNKLVDGCYSWWVGGSHLILASGFGNRSENVTHGLFYNSEKLLKYILQCCQGASGGLRDKPPKRPDQYHTCYCLLGLSSIAYDYRIQDNHWLIEPSCLYSSLDFLLPTHPIYCIPLGLEKKMLSYFKSI
ncbi:farnesyltransferase beta subunit Cpp1 [Schizosaccharomyces cryophilus OY26]|uniref:Protein farnesyltransferase subunit beta n=1 Tax=Schizosaccharomyces cryophilus (strain OY26 / ATCC MYA-4695 / CBS 11777 / NBRC 106824 / NRRL Y48691) TaxID=653667 RepID=S9X6R1_SCHCR|nr:farnesyltransferase beta subunit Cpp1 [Schizosaccharomyces cryophilus OY26]EPY52777.1 farnesyltransferase beta subunit Cpp1 [Schizosaccharomyces cryophilus OY26]